MSCVFRLTCPPNKFSVPLMSSENNSGAWKTASYGGTGNGLRRGKKGLGLDTIDVDASLEGLV